MDSCSQGAKRSQMEGRRRSFTDDNKQQAVELAASGGRSIGPVAKKLGLRDSMLRRWVEQLGVRRAPTTAARRPTRQARGAETRFRLIEDRPDDRVTVLCDVLGVSRARLCLALPPG